MKRWLPFIGLLTIGLIILIISRCVPITGGEPTNLQISADTDSTIKLTWSAPAEGTPDKYIVYFKRVGGADFRNVAEPTTTSYTHNPNGETGEYKVSAMFGKEEYKGDDVVSTIPHHTTARTVWELNAPGHSGYGWSRQDGKGETYTMTLAANAANVDFYITNFAAGYSATPYSISSPDMGPGDPGRVVPAGAWRINGISGALTDPKAPLPRYIKGTTYFNYTDIDRDPIYVGVRTADEYYALVKVSGVNTAQGTVQIETWFQKVKGLRLIKH